jgi:hypothetical protein
VDVGVRTERVAGLIAQHRRAGHLRRIAQQGALRKANLGPQPPPQPAHCPLPSRGRHEATDEHCTDSSCAVFALALHPAVAPMRRPAGAHRERCPYPAQRNATSLMETLKARPLRRGQSGPQLCLPTHPTHSAAPFSAMWAAAAAAAVRLLLDAPAGTRHAKVGEMAMLGQVGWPC